MRASASEYRLVLSNKSLNWKHLYYIMMMMMMMCSSSGGREKPSSISRSFYSPPRPMSPKGRRNAQTTSFYWAAEQIVLCYRTTLIKMRFICKLFYYITKYLHYVHFACSLVMIGLVNLFSTYFIILVT